MVTLYLTDQERETLVNLLECALSDLHTEIVHTESYDLKEILKTRKLLLIDLKQRLVELGEIAAVG